MKFIPFLFALVLPFQTEGIEDLLKVDQALRGKAFEKAVKLADEAIAKSPKNERLYYLRGLANSGLRDYTSALKDFDNSLKANPKFYNALDQRGSANFRLGKMKEAGADFDEYIKLVPDEYPGHWRRGIVLYYLGRFKEGKEQFESYQKVENSDVENGVWHYLCFARAETPEKARAAMLPIQGDRRVPMTEVYLMFQGKFAPDKILEIANKAPAEQEKIAPFYAHLYLGLYYESIDDKKKAAEHMEKAAKLGPLDHYMGDVARVHWDILKKDKDR